MRVIFFLMWYRIFSRTDCPLSPALLLDHLNSAGLVAHGDFRGNDLGWTSAELHIGAGSPVYLERYLTNEDDLRGDLNTWAAWLETATWSPHSTALMERIIQTQQLITLRKPIDHSDEIKLDRLCLEACQFIAANCDGIYQIDDEGWFAADGALLVKEY